VIRSNTIEIFVKPAAPRSSRYERAKRVLAEPGNARLLFYKSGRTPLRKLEPLSEVSKDFRRTPTAAHIQYSLARALVTNIQDVGRSTKRRAQETAAERALKHALDSGHLGPPRRRRAQDLLDALREI
jgi:hypothetical protein